MPPPPPLKSLIFCLSGGDQAPEDMFSISIKSPNITDPLQSLRGEWEELEERFNCAEMIE